MQWSIDVTPARPTKPRSDPHGHAKYQIENWDKHYADMAPEAAVKLVQACVSDMALDTKGCDDDREPEPRETWRAAVRPWPKGGWRGVGVASITFTDTPKSLYRLIYLTEPKKLDLSDMYKTGEGFIAFTSACRRFAVRAELWKYELACRFYATKTMVTRVQKPSAIAYNGPAVRKGRIQAVEEFEVKDKDAWAFFEMVKVALTRKWMVYGGNDFVV
jgi:hypothetical protein